MYEGTVFWRTEKCLNRLLNFGGSEIKTSHNLIGLTWSKVLDEFLRSLCSFQGFCNLPGLKPFQNKQLEKFFQENPFHQNLWNEKMKRLHQKRGVADRRFFFERVLNGRDCFLLFSETKNFSAEEKNLKLFNERLTGRPPFARRPLEKKLLTDHYWKRNIFFSTINFAFYLTFNTEHEYFFRNW